MPLTDGSLITRVQLEDLTNTDLVPAGKKSVVQPGKFKRMAMALKYEASVDMPDPKAGAAALVWGLFYARTVAHLLHLQTRSFAQHMALDGLYNALPGLVDSYIECFQGKYGLVTEYPYSVGQFPTNDPVAFIEGLASWFLKARNDSPYASELQNLLDEIAAQIDSTAYKLKNLS